MASAGLALVGFPAAGVALVGLVVAVVLFCTLTLSFFSSFANKAPHSLGVLLHEVISLDGRRRRRSGKGGVSQTLVSD